MKKVLVNITSYLLALLLLVSTLQFSIYKMECLMSGKTKISLSNFDNCNTDTPIGTIKSICCCFHQMDLDFEFDTDLTPSFAIQIPIESTYNFVLLPKVVEVPIEINFFTDLSPPSGFNLLKIVQVFRL